MSLFKWQSTSICLVHSLCTGFIAMDKSAWLPHLRVIWEVDLIPNYFSNCVIHATSQVVRALALYLASTLDLETTFYFLLCHEMGEWQTSTQNPIVDILVMGHLVQSLFKYALTTIGDCVASNTPCPGDDLRYLNTLSDACN